VVFFLDKLQTLELHLFWDRRSRIMWGVPECHPIQGIGKTRKKFYKPILPTFLDKELCNFFGRMNKAY
jgi:hypothetical protein